MLIGLPRVSCQSNHFYHSAVSYFINNNKALRWLIRSHSVVNFLLTSRSISIRMELDFVRCLLTRGFREIKYVWAFIYFQSFDWLEVSKISSLSSDEIEHRVAIVGSRRVGRNFIKHLRSVIPLWIDMESWWEGNLLWGKSFDFIILSKCFSHPQHQHHHHCAA